MPCSGHMQYQYILFDIIHSSIIVFLIYYTAPSISLNLGMLTYTFCRDWHSKTELGNSPRKELFLT